MQLQLIKPKTGTIMLLFLSFVKYSSAFVQKHTDISFFMPLSRRFFLESPLTIWFTHCRLQVEGLHQVNLGGETYA